MSVPLAVSAILTAMVNLSVRQTISVVLSATSGILQLTGGVLLLVLKLNLDVAQVPTYFTA